MSEYFACQAEMQVLPGDLGIVIFLLYEYDHKLSEIRLDACTHVLKHRKYYISFNAT